MTSGCLLCYPLACQLLSSFHVSQRVHSHVAVLCLFQASHVQPTGASSVTFLGAPQPEHNANCQEVATLLTPPDSHRIVRPYSLAQYKNCSAQLYVHNTLQVRLHPHENHVGAVCLCHYAQTQAHSIIASTLPSNLSSHATHHVGQAAA